MSKAGRTAGTKDRGGELFNSELDFRAAQCKDTASCISETSDSAKANSSASSKTPRRAEVNDLHLFDCTMNTELIPDSTAVPIVTHAAYGPPA